MKIGILTATGVIGGAIATLYGGWSTGMATLVIMLSADYITGLIVAGVFKKSKKSENGALESRAGFKGLCRKFTVLLIVALAYRMDVTIGTTYIQNAVIIGFIANEMISIVENAGLMGIPIPDAITRGIEMLVEKKNEENTEVLNNGNSRTNY